VDEWIVYMAPVILGDGARGLFHLPELTLMADRLELSPPVTRAVGRDLRLIFQRPQASPL
jgi:diaminohydroxyphosphoribosylaminopyrimidine deaminase/5-amino-6-(5-phosphoribosylamino)uracil reductase